jgi:TolB-like protein/Tfp pilus assembly protein PilF
MVSLQEFLAELRRRNVVRVAMAYLAGAWLVVQLVDELGPILGMPDWTQRLVLAILAAGLVIALVLSWIYEFTSQGIRTTTAVDLDDAVQHIHGRKLDFIIIGLLLLALGYFVWESRFASEPKVTDATSIAVLPFRDLSANHDQEHLADGIAEELLTALSRMPGLRVAGRTSSFAFKSRDLPLDAIARELGVSHVLEGSVRFSGQQLRVTAQLVNAADGFQRWSQEFDGAVTDIFAVQDQISAAVAEGLKLHLGAGGASLQSVTETLNLGAYDQYLLGRYHLARRTSESLCAALEHFRAAIEQDPAYSAAYSALATTLAISHYYLPTEAPSAIADEAKQAAQQALQLNPGNSEAWAALGTVYLVFDRDWSGALESLQNAVELSPNDAGIINLYGDYFYLIGDYANALQWESRAAELEPLSAVHQHELALVYGLLGRLEEAIALERRAVQLSPEFRNAWASLGRMLIEAGQPEELAGFLDQQRELLHANVVAALRARLELARGDPAAARARAEEVRQLAEQEKLSLTHVAHLFALLGDDQQAAALVEAATAASDPLLVSPLYFFLPEDFPAMPLLRAALEQAGLGPLFDLRRINAAAGRGRSPAGRNQP